VEDRIAKLEYKVDIKKKELVVNLRAMKGICKNSSTPSKE
jgi:hypothetical protein